MRLIKFRAWDGVKMSRNTALMTMVQGDFSLIDDDVIWMQYTGLRDKNGKEIYEGDIIYSDNMFVAGEPLIVELSGGCYLGKIKKKKSYSSIKNLTDQPCEVIGNIYENKDLLEAE